MGRIHFVREAVRGETAPEMVAAPGGDMKGTADLFVLNVAPGNRKDLSAEAQFPEFAGHRIIGQFFIVRCDDGRIPFDETRFLIRPPVTCMRPRVPSAYLRGNSLPPRPVRNKSPRQAGWLHRARCRDRGRGSSALLAGQVLA